MPNPIPGVSSTGNRIPQSVTGNKGVGVLVNTSTEMTVTPKLSAADDFTNLSKWITVYGTPGITSGMLSGDGVVRYQNQAMTDNMKASAVVGSIGTGKTRLIICADESVTRYYALEVSRGLTTTFSIIKGNSANSVETASSSLIGALFSLFFSLFSIFSESTTKFDTTTVTLNVSDEVSIWFDRDASTIRTYINDVATACSIEVPRSEIPHGPGFRNAGVAQGITALNPGVRFTSYTLEDV
jgi:hypothetical protein